MFSYRNYLKSYPIDYNYEETIARYYNDLTIDEEKRNRPRPGCDCHVKVQYLFYFIIISLLD